MRVEEVGLTRARARTRSTHVERGRSRRLRFGYAVRVDVRHAQHDIEQLALGRTIVATNKSTHF